MWQTAIVSVFASTHATRIKDRIKKIKIDMFWQQAFKKMDEARKRRVKICINKSLSRSRCQIGRKTENRRDRRTVSINLKWFIDVIQRLKQQ